VAPPGEWEMLKKVVTPNKIVMPPGKYRQSLVNNGSQSETSHSLGGTTTVLHSLGGA